MDNPLLDAHRRLGAGLGAEWEAESLRRRYSYAVPTEEALSLLAGLAPLIEVGAGLGYWARLASARGCSVEAFDSVTAADNEYTWGDRWFDVQEGGPERVAEHPDHTLFLCWPPRDDSMAARCLQDYQGTRLLTILPGTAEVPHAGDVAFHHRLHREWTVERRIQLPRWPEEAFRADLCCHLRTRDHEQQQQSTEG